MKIFVFSIMVLLTCPSLHLKAQGEPATSKPISLLGIPVQKRAPDFACWEVSPSLSDPPKTIVESGPEETVAPVKAKKHTDKNADPLEAIAGKKFAPPGGKDASPARFSGYTITKTAQIIHIEGADMRAQARNVWITGGQEFSVSADGKTVGEVAPPTSQDSNNPLYADFSKMDFPGFEWVSAKNYAGVEEVNGQPCLIFRDLLKEPSTPEAAPSAGTLRFAAVNYYSRLPVALAVGSEKQNYSFKFPPAALQVLPEQVALTVRELATDRKKTERSSSKPY